MLQSANVAISRDVAYELGVRVEGAQITVTLNGEPAISLEDSTHAQGTVGFKAQRSLARCCR